MRIILTFQLPRKEFTQFSAGLSLATLRGREPRNGGCSEGIFAGMKLKKKKDFYTNVFSSRKLETVKKMYRKKDRILGR